MDDSVKKLLSKITLINGVENSVLVHRDGVPIGSSGVWFNKDEVFEVASATSGIYGIAMKIFSNIKYVLAESKESKVFIAPIPNTPEYYLIITTASRTNLAAIFVELKQVLVNIANYLKNKDISAPLRSFSKDDITKITKGFKVKQKVNTDNHISKNIIFLPSQQILNLKVTLNELNEALPGIKNISLSIKGIFEISTSTQDHFKSAMIDSLYKSTSKIMNYMRNDVLESVLIETQYARYFMYSTLSGVLGIDIEKGRQRLGLIRILINSYLKKINNILSKSFTEKSITPSLRDVLLYSEPALVR